MVVWGKPYGHEHPLHLQALLAIGGGKQNPLHPLVPGNLLDSCLIVRRHIGGGQKPADSGLVGAELVPPVDEVYLPADSGEVQGVLRRGVPSPDDGDGFSLEKGPVAGGAVGNPLAGKTLLPFTAQLAVDRPVGGNHRLGNPCGRRGLHIEPGVGLGDGGNRGKLDFRPQSLRLPVEGVGKVEAGDAGHTGVVFNLPGVDNLSPVHVFLQDNAAQPAAAGVDGGGQPRRPRSDDNNVNLFHDTTSHVNQPCGQA